MHCFCQNIINVSIIFCPAVRERLFPPLSAACVRTGRRKWSCELDELRLLRSASGPNGALVGSRSDRAGSGVLAASPVAPDGTGRTGQRHIRGREMDPGCPQRECPEWSRGRVASSPATRRRVSFSFWAVILMSIKSEERIEMTLKTALSLVSWLVVGFCDKADVTTRRKDLMLCCVKTLDKSTVCRCISGGSEST